MTRSDGREKAKFWLDPALDNLELLRATYVTHSFVPHVHEGFAIGVAQAGVQVFRYRNEDHFMTAGSIAVLNPGEIHTGHAAVEQGWTYRMLYPAAPVLQQAASEVMGQACDVPFFPTPIIHDSYLARLILNLHLALEDSATPPLERQSRLLWTMAQLVARHADSRPRLRPTGTETQSVRQVKRFLESHYAENVTLEQLAALVHLSPFYLLRVFRDEVGMPPHAYLMQLRIRQAKKLLLAGLPIAETAALTGFADQSHLARRFKGVVGVTPGQYRAQSKNVQDRRN